MHTQRQAFLAGVSSECEAASRAGDWQRLEDLARQWAAVQPDEYAPWDYAALAAEQSQDYALAAEYLSRMPLDSPIEAYLDLSQIQMERLNQPVAAIETCQRTLEQYPDDIETHKRLLFYYSMTCQRQKVRKEANRAIDLGIDIGATYAYLISASWLTFTNGSEMNRRWLQSQPSSELYQVAAVVHLVSNHELRAIARSAAETAGEAPEGATRTGFYTEQVQLLRERYPQNIELLSAELAELCRDGDIDAVAQRLTEAPTETTADNRFWRYKGWYHGAVGQWDKAIEAYQRALRLDPFDFQAQFDLAEALRFTRGVEHSVEMLETARLGKELMNGIRKSERMDLLQPPALYDDLLRYMQLCGREAYAARLEDWLQTNP